MKTSKKMETEIWKDIKDYEGLYQISNLGRVKSLYFNNERILKVQQKTNGYFIVSLCKDAINKTKKVHQLVAIAFLGHIPCGNNLVVDHINRIKTDNHLENLQVITHRENLSKDKKGTSKYTGVSWCKRNKKWFCSIRINKIQKQLGYFKIELEAHQAYQLALKELLNE